jgi:hypothetical protein
MVFVSMHTFVSNDTNDVNAQICLTGQRRVGYLHLSLGGVRYMAYLDLSNVLTNAPRDCWLALTEDGTKLVAWGETMEDVVAKAKAQGTDEPLLCWSPDKSISRILEAAR